MKFLHIADVHLGCTRYQLPESPRDFYEAWIDVLRKYGIEENVDFVIMCGDFFHKRSVPPETMNYAVEGLTMMRNAGIPVISIEGNHDQKHTDSEFSWLRSLSSWGLLKLLEPSITADGTFIYEPWNEETKRGGFVDIGRARIFGSEWFGLSGNWAIPMLTDSIKQNRRSGGFHILLLHTDVEGHQMHPLPAISVAALKELQAAVEYVGLGHTHKYYEIDNWAFNPGSIEITNVSEYRENRGAFVVEVAEDNSVIAEHVSNYHYRPFQRVMVHVDHLQDQHELTERVLQQVRLGEQPTEPGSPAPILEITLRGQLGFPNSLIEMQKIRDHAKRSTGALHVRIKNQSVPAELVETPLEADDPGRERLEQRVIEDLIIRDNRFKAHSVDITQAVLGSKRMALGDEPAEKIAEFIALKACQKP